MSKSFPYTLYVCPCSDVTGATIDDDVAPENELNGMFNPHDPSSAYALYSLDYLLFCDDCNQIKCPKCVSEEVLNWYCPNCLFETHSTGVRGDRNRCSRNCYTCPVCTSPAIITRLDSSQEDGLSTSKDGSEETYILTCGYCDWTSLQAGLRFDRPTKITEQISKARKVEPDHTTDDGVPPEGNLRWAHDVTFEKLSSFYKEQLADSSDSQGRGGSDAYGSPANLARIIHMYGGLSHKSLAKAQDRPRPMREANRQEGLTVYTSGNDDEEIINRLRSQGIESTASTFQRDLAPANSDVTFADDLWPAATRLRTRRGKRCRQCRQFVVRPDTKVTGMRYRIRIIAQNNIPRLSIQPLGAQKQQQIQQHPAFVLRSEHVAKEATLQPFEMKQYVLTLRNPIFETVKVTLATPGTTPGRVSSKVTILCPSFDIGPAGDVWDDALSGSTMAVGLGDGSRKAAMASLTGHTEGDRQPEAGKIWEQTRNSTSVILEVVAGTLRPHPGSNSSSTPAPVVGDDILEIPIYVRVEWTAEGTDENGQKGKPEAKEVSYWCVIGVGRIVE